MWSRLSQVLQTRYPPTRVRPLGIGVPRLLVMGWAAAMVTLPVILWTVGDRVLPWTVSGTVMSLASVVSLILIEQTGRRATLRTMLIVLGGGWLVEVIGSTQGLAFGHYAYSPALQPQLGGVPLLIPLAWLLMLPSAWAIGCLAWRKLRAGSCITVRWAAFPP